MSSRSIMNGFASTLQRCAGAIFIFRSNAFRGLIDSTKRCSICSRSSVAFASGSVLRAVRSDFSTPMDRGVKVEQVQQAVEMSRARKIQSGMFLMWGYEGEEMEDIEATIRHVSKTKPDIFFTTVSYPIKGTPYYQQVQSKLVQLQPWAQSSDRDIKIAGRHSRAYSYADRLLRDEVELARRLGHRRQTPERSQSSPKHRAGSGRSVLDCLEVDA